MLSTLVMLTLLGTPRAGGRPETEAPIEPTPAETTEREPALPQEVPPCKGLPLRPLVPTPPVIRSGGERGVVSDREPLKR